MPKIQSLIPKSSSIIYLFTILLLSSLQIKPINASKKPIFLFPPKTVLTWINGIGFNIHHMNNGQTNLSKLFGNKPILYCHNPTAMVDEDDTFGYIGDFAQATTQKLGKITNGVDKLVRHLKEAIQTVGPKGRVIHIAHSQGALITSLAMKQLTKQEMSQMEIICFGGAETIESSPTYPFARCINYYSVNDPLLFVVPNAAKALRSGFMGVGGIKYHNVDTVITNDNDNNNSSNENNNCNCLTASSLAALVDPKYEPEFVFLTPRAGDPITDHGLFGPTYIDALRWEGRRYITLYLPPWYPMYQFVHEKGMIGIEVLSIFFKVVLRNTILPIVLLVMKWNMWCRDHILIPIGLFLIMIWEKILEIIRILRGEDLYEPVVVPSPALSSSTKSELQKTASTTTST